MPSNTVIPSVMKAVFSENPGTPLVLREVPVPVPGPGEVLVKVAAAPINPSDLAMIRNVYLSKDLVNFIPGREGSGTVVAAGKGLLPKLWMGKRVACSAAYTSGGTWAEYTVTKAGLCFPLKKNISFEQGAMSFVNPLTALSFIEIALKNRHKAIINNAAASALGRMVELMGKKKGIPVINIVRSAKNADMLRSAGSDYVIDSSTVTFFEDLRELSEKLEATLMFDSVCNRQLQKMIEALPHGSSVVIYGNLSGHENIHINPRSFMDRNIAISGFYLGSRTKENGMLKNLLNIRQVSSLMSSGMKIKIQSRFPLEQAQQAVDTYINSMSEGKVVLVV